MTRRLTRRILVVCGAGLAMAAGGTGAAHGDQDPPVLSAVQFLKAHANTRSTGESAMIALALLKAELPLTDPALQACIAKVRARFVNSTYQPESASGIGVYEAAASAMALANLDATENRAWVALIAAYVRSRQNANGSWDYSGRSKGDCSISQYAVLGLWEAENVGVDIPPSVWDRAADWYMSVQSGGGSWNYHRDDPSTPETLSMTAAGVGSLLICQRQLDRYRQSKRGTSTLLAPLAAAGSQADYKPSTSNAQIDQAVKRGVIWIGANFAPNNPRIVGQTPYYMLYGLERIGALAERQTIGRVDWYNKGRDFISSTQKTDGSWTGTHGPEMNTVWATLFLTKSTAKTMRRIKVNKLGAGTLLGGRELPKDLTSMTVAGGRVVSRPMNGAIEGMLAVLEDPRADQADAAVAGLVDRYYVQGPAALKPYRVRFRKMLSDRDVGVRRVASWALAHMGELDVVPLLIEAMVVPNEDEEVITAIQQGLQLLSRKLKGFGPSAPSSADARRAAAQKWREWYQAIRPLDLDDQSVDPAATSDSATPGSQS